MDLPSASSSRIARRRRVAVSVVAAVSLVAGAMVAAGDDSGSGSPRRALAGETGSARLVHPGWQPHTGPVPILMYHQIERPRPGVRNIVLYVSRRTFAAQMRWLDRHGFEAVTVDEVENAWSRGATLPRRPIVLSFDDGYASQYLTALPILRRHRWPGVLSLAVGNMRPGAPITPSRVAKLVRAGWELASHTISHVDLRYLDRRRLQHELRDSRRILRDMFKVPVHNFTYPGGLYNAATIRAVRRAGYRGALTVTPGLASRNRPFELKRIRITEDMHVRGLARKLHSRP